MESLQFVVTLRTGEKLYADPVTLDQIVQHNVENGVFTKGEISADNIKEKIQKALEEFNSGGWKSSPHVFVTLRDVTHIFEVKDVTNVTYRFIDEENNEIQSDSGC